MKLKLTGKKLLLLLLYTPTEIMKAGINTPISGRTRLMKMIFLFENEIWSNFKKDKTFEELDDFDFKGWNYGPFSKKIFNDLEFLINQEYITVQSGLNIPIEAELSEYEYWAEAENVEGINEFDERKYEEELFSLSIDKGIEKTKNYWNSITKNQKEILIEFKKVLNNSSLDRILEYVYKKYNKYGYIDNSLIRERYLS